VNHEIDVIDKLEPDDLQQVPGGVGSDGEDLGRVGCGVEVDDGDGMVEGMEDGSVVNTVFAGRSMDLHIGIL
jgi:hypothetical protein